jgi:hypothetical protein
MAKKMLDATGRAIEADEIVIALQSFNTADPTQPLVPIAVVQGARLRAGHAAVKCAPQYFIADGSSDEEIHKARHALLPEAAA